MTPVEHWAVVCADRSLRDLPYKIETNRYNQIIMSPASYWHSDYQAEICRQLGLLMPGGRPAVECAVQTADGVRVPDVAWVSRELRAQHRHAISLPVAPEICVEILSFSNGREEILTKMQLLFAAGAREVWLCDWTGRVDFYHSGAGEPQQLERSALCPDFPVQIDTD